MDDACTVKFMFHLEKILKLMIFSKPVTSNFAISIKTEVSAFLATIDILEKPL